MQPDSPLNSKLLIDLQQRLLAMVEIIGYRLASLDDDLLEGLGSLQGKCIAIEIIDLQKTIYCFPGTSGIRLSMEAPENQADAIIRARLVSLVNLASQSDKVSTSIQEGISFHGDVALAQRLQKLISNVDIDWEEILSRQFGDVAGVQVFRLLQQVKGFIQQSSSSLFQSGSEYLQEEIRLTPTLVEQEKLRADVTRLRHDVDRCEARIRQLANRLQKSTS